MSSKNTRNAGDTENLIEHTLVEQTLRFVAERAWGIKDTGFFDALVEYLGKSLHVKFAFCDRLSLHDATQVETIALYANGKKSKNVSYTLRGTPCDNVIGREACCYVEGIRNQFPDDQLLNEMKAESYAGTPLWSADGTPLGLIAIVDDKPIANPALVMTILQIVAVRAGSELERIEVLEELERNSAKLVSEVSQHKLTNKALQEAKEEAERANRSKSEFLASMSHELRTPMNAVLGFAQMLKYSPTDPLSDRQIEYIDSVIAGGEHLNQLVDDILDLARIEADQISLTIENASTQESVADSIAMVMDLAIQYGVKIINNIDKLDAQILVTDKGRLRQVILNLLSNAIKYNKAGGTVTLNGAVTDHDFFRLSVEDTGPGIPKKEQSRIFEMFHRLDADPMISRDGVGIGLSVSKALVEKMGGAIGMYGEEGTGSTFWVELPLESNDEVLIWSDEYKVGVDAIDADHQKIFGLTNVLSRNRIEDDELDAAIEDLIYYTKYHFRREETIMRIGNYPGLEEHQKRHQDLIGKIDKIASAWKKTQDPSTRHTLRVFLRNWWINHIVNVDTTITKYVQGKADEIKRALEDLASIS